MKKFVQLLVVAIVGTTGNIYAQNGTYAGDALRFSRTDYGSSARFKGLGNAQISLGGDISSIGGNPAGLGMFTRSEFSITPEFNNVKSDASFLGQNTKDTKNRLNLNQAAMVWYNPVVRPKGSDLNKGVLSVVWGIGFNRNNDFGGDFSYAGTNNNSSIADAFAERANGVREPDLAGAPGMAFDNFLIDQKSGDNLSYVPATSQTNTQSKNESRVGSTSELNFSGAINISNQLYLGASIGFVNMRYINNSVYTEQGKIINTLPAGAPAPARPNTEVGKDYDLAYSTGQHTTGSGINGRLGLIYKPINEVRIGATFQAPTWMHVEEDYAEVLNTRFSQGGQSAGSVFSNVYNSNFNYNLRTPYKASLGGSVIIGQNGLLSADIDYVDYASTKLSVSDGYSDLISENNQYIKQNYKSAINYRIGGEYRIDDFTLRAGYGLNGTPYKSDDKNVFDVKYYSGGLGYRFNQYYVDLAYQRTETTNTFAPYELNNFSEPVATAKVARNNVFLTVGVKF
jgi:long-subunit fatty acid transport protein